MRHTSPIWLVMIAVVALVGFTACKPRQPGTTDAPRGSGAEVLHKYEEGRLQFHTLSIKGKGTYSNPAEKQSFTFTYRINMLKDSLIWASISKFGIEGMRALVSEDSVWVRRMDAQEGIRCDLSFIKKSLGMDVDFQGLQSLLIGEVVGGTAGLRHVEGTKNPYQYNGRMGGYETTWSISGRDNKVVEAFADEAILGHQTQLHWEEFQPLGKTSFAHLVRMSMLAPKQMSFEMNHNSVTVDGDDINFKFSFPEDYAIKNCMDAAGGK
jgi:Domain of unknown function (DUF4292)